MPKILIVDDAEFLRVRISRMLTSNGYEVVEADNGANAVNKYKESRPDAVLMDITMPQMDGIQCTKEIRKLADPKKNGIPIKAAIEEIQTAVKNRTQI